MVVGGLGVRAVDADCNVASLEVCRLGQLAQSHAGRSAGAIYADAGELERLSRLRKLPRGWPQPYPTELITPRPQAR